MNYPEKYRLKTYLTAEDNKQIETETERAIDRLQRAIKKVFALKEEEGSPLNLTSGPIQTALYHARAAVEALENLYIFEVSCRHTEILANAQEARKIVAQKIADDEHRAVK